VFFCDRPARSAEHPTQKPVELVTAMLRNSSRRGDLVFDSFAGSGTTLIACERLGRRCVAIELDPRYCDVVRQRYKEYVGG
jgi:DNA modification methylase